MLDSAFMILDILRDVPGFPQLQYVFCENVTKF